MEGAPDAMTIPEFIEIARIFGGWGVAGYFVVMMMTDRLMTAAERDRLLKRIESEVNEKQWWQRAAFNNHALADRSTSLVEQFVRGEK